MAAVDKRLVRREHGLIQLLDPPFDTSSLNPGYIKGYAPGVRENGGQYTHAAIWAAMAFARMGDNRRAWELFTMINPVNHATSAEEAARYSVEPYVVAADVYAVPPHTGRGGWTWYTGSAAWMYRLIVESLLGLRLEVDKLRFAPCLPAEWEGFKIHYRYRETVYHIAVLQTPAENGEMRVTVDGIEQHDKTIPLVDDHKEHEAEVRVPRTVRSTLMKTNRMEVRDNPATPELLGKMHAYWRAANYLSVGQIYLYDNALLKQPLKLEHIKPRLLGHWGTTPGLNFIYVHLNRVIKEHDLNVIYITGPGHGGPGLVANAYLEGTYSEVYPNISQDEDGMKRLFKQFSFPGGIPSHVAPETPGSIHEGGELGYSLSHAFGAAFDNPDLLVACVVGDGEAETGPLATSWHSNKFLNPVHDGAVLPILHLNGYKIAGPTVLARIPRDELEALFRGYGYTPYFVEGDDPEKMHAAHGRLRSTPRSAEIQRIQNDARANGFKKRPRWPMMVLRSPKGWTGPKVVDGQADRGHVPFAPGADGRDEPSGACEDSGKVDEELSPAGAVRPDRQAPSRTRGTGPERRAPHERQSARQRRPPAARPAPAGFPRLRGRTCRSPAPWKAKPRASRASSSAT